MNLILHLESFTASEAERITGVSTVQQRDWRRHGFLPPLEGGKAVFDAKLLSGILAAKALNDAGIPPAVGWPLARSCGALIYARCLNSGRGVFDPQALVREPLVQAGRPLPRYAITGDGRSWGWANTPVEVVDQLQLHIASVVLDLEHAAEQLAKRAGRALAIIEPAE